MSRTILLVLSVLVASQAASLTSDNYAGLKSFVQGVLNGYTGKSNKLPELCLTSAAQAKLDEDIVATVSAFLRGRPEDALDSLKTLVGDIEGMFKDCGLDTVITHFNQDVSKSGFWWMLQNIFLNVFDLEKELGSMLEYLFVGKWQKAGTNLGKFFGIIAPIEKLEYSAAKADMEAIFAGLLTGLEADPEKPGPCYTEMISDKSVFITILHDVEDYWHGDAPTFDKILDDIKDVYHAVKDFKPDACDFSSLITAVKSVSKTSLAFHFASHLITCTKDVFALRKCSSDFTECGTVMGELFRLLVGWSLN